MGLCVSYEIKLLWVCWKHWDLLVESGMQITALTLRMTDRDGRCVGETERERGGSGPKKMLTGAWLCVYRVNRNDVAQYWQWYWLNLHDGSIHITQTKFHDKYVWAVSNIKHVFIFSSITPWKWVFKTRHPRLLCLFAFRFSVFLLTDPRECRSLCAARYAWSNTVCRLHVELFARVVKLICLLVHFIFLNLHSFIVVAADENVSTASVTWLWHRKLPIFISNLIATNRSTHFMDIGPKSHNRMLAVSMQHCSTVDVNWWIYCPFMFAFYCVRASVLFKFRTCCSFYVRQNSVNR